MKHQMLRVWIKLENVQLLKIIVGICYFKKDGDDNLTNDLFMCIFFLPEKQIIVDGSRKRLLEAIKLRIDKIVVTKFKIETNTTKKLGDVTFTVSYWIGYLDFC